MDTYFLETHRAYANVSYGHLHKYSAKKVEWYQRFPPASKGGDNDSDENVLCGRAGDAVPLHMLMQ